MPAVHQRQLIRDAVVEAFKADTKFAAALMAANGAVQAAKRIFDTRLVEWEERYMPAVSIYTGKDEVDGTKTTAAKELRHFMDLTIEVGVLGKEPEKQLDALCLQVERIMAVDEVFGGVCAGSNLKETDFEFTAVGEQFIAVAFVTYTIEFTTQQPYPEDNPQAEFLHANVRHNLSNDVLPADQAEDDFNVRGA